MTTVIRSRLLLPAVISLLLCACASQGQAASVASSVSSKTASSSSAPALHHLKKAPAGYTEAPPVTIPPEKRVIPILVYHHVRKQEGWAKSTWSWKMTVSPDTFDKQMKWIVDHNYTPIDLDTYVAIMKGQVAGPEKPIVLTFDDNNQNQYTTALPILKKYGITATFYIITSRIGNSTITADQLKELQADGMDIESHTVTHRVLTLLSDKELDAELVNSKKALEALLGKTINHLAYPGTADNARVRQHVAAAGYVTATIMDPRPATIKDDMLKLPRIMMTDDTNLTKTLP